VWPVALISYESPTEHADHFCISNAPWWFVDSIASQSGVLHVVLTVTPRNSTIIAIVFMEALSFRVTRLSFQHFARHTFVTESFPSSFEAHGSFIYPGCSPRGCACVYDGFLARGTPDQIPSQCPPFSSVEPEGKLTSPLFVPSSSTQLGAPSSPC
jgi:hypothetical protein